MTPTSSSKPALILLDRSAVPLTSAKPGEALQLKVEPGQRLRLLREGKDNEAPQLAKGVILLKRGEDLVVRSTEGEEINLQGFYTACKADACSLTVAGEEPAGFTLNAGNDAGAVAGASASGTVLVYAHGEQASLMSLLQSSGYDSGLAGLHSAGAWSTYVPGSDDAGWLSGSVGLPGGLSLPKVLLPLLGVALVGGLVAGQSSDDATPQEPPPPPAPQPTTVTLSGNVVAGPVIGGHGLSATAYAADGRVLTSAALNPDGSFSLSFTGYTGAVLVRVSDSSAEADYFDEGNQANKDLSVDLRAVTNVPQTGTYIVNVNMLTELAVRSLGLSGGDNQGSASTLGALSAAQVSAANQAVAAAVGLSGQDLVTGAPPVAVVTTTGSANTAANDYGRLLAAVSGAEQGSSSAAVLAELVQSLNTSGSGTPGLNAAGQALLVQGAANVPGTPESRQALIDATSGLVDSPAAANGLRINVIAGDATVTAAEAAAGIPVAGVAAAGANVVVTWGSATRSVTADAAGQWAVSFSADDVPAQGASVISASAGGASVQRAVFTDTQLSAPTLTSATAVNDATPLLSGSADAGSVVTVTLGGATFSTRADSSGHWQLDTGTATPSSGSFSLGADGAKTVTVRATDSAGNTASMTVGLAFDTTAPAAATLDRLVTNDLTPTLSGTAEPGSTVAVTVGGASFTATTDATGRWTIDTGSSTPTSGTLNLGGEGTKPVTVTVTDPAGNAGPTLTTGITMDATPPAAPTLAPLNTNDPTPTLSGTAEAGSTVTITLGGATFNGTAGPNGQWSIDTGTTPPTSGTLDLGGDGTKAVTVKVVDPAGNPGPTLTGSITMDTTPPGVPTLDPLTTNDPTPTLTGTAEPGSVITVTLGGGTFTGTTDPTGHWTIDTGTTPPTSGTLDLGGDGSKPVTVTATDPTGNTGLPFTDGITVDTTVPSAPTLALVMDTGSSNSDGITSNGLVNITGLESGASWQYSLDGGSTWTAGTGGSVTLTGDGAKSLSVRQLDAVGNTGAASAALAFTLDSSAPSALTSALAADTGSSSDGITSNGQVNITGLESGASWQYSLDGGSTWAAGTGSSLTLTGDGAKSVTVRQLDAAGNTGAASNSLTFTLDGSAPSAPTLALAADTGSSDAITSNGQVNIAGLESGAIWQYSLDGGSTWTAGTGSSLTLTGDGAKSVTVRQFDAAGNTGAASNSLTFTLDGSAPSAPTLALAADTGSSDGITSNGLVNITGLESGASWEYSLDGGSTWAAGTGSSVALTGDGAKSITVRQLDAAGNAGAASTALAFSLDSSAPSAPTLALAADTGSSDGITSNGQVDVAGLESGASWQYSLDGGSTWTAGAGSSVTLTGDGAKSVTFRQLDAASNASAASTALAFTLDSSAPSAPTLALAADTGSSGSDGITSNGLVNISGLESGASWQYSLNGGSTWTAGTGSSVTVTGDGAKSLSVRQSDAAGNAGAASTVLAFTLDTAAPGAPTLALDADTGASSSDGITSNGLVNITGLESGASWQYSLNAGSTWTDGSGSSIAITGDGAKSVTVRQLDAAGNAGAASTALAFTLDGTAPQQASASVNGSSLILTMDQALDTLNPPAASDFTVLVGGVARTVSSVALSGSTVTLTLASSVTNGQVVTVAYTDPTTGNDGNALQDVAGNDAASVAAQAVTNATPLSGVNLSAIAAGSGGFVINGQCVADISGISVASAGDVNGDGLADLIVGAGTSDPAAGFSAGRSYVVFGKSTNTAVNLSAVAAGTGGFVINGQGVSDISGWSVSGAGDVNGDGLADLIVGAYQSDPAGGTDAGRSYVVFGKSTGTAIDLSAVASGTGGFVIDGQGSSDQSGFSVASAGDVNGDGLADLIVGAKQSDPAAGSAAGRSYVVFGQSTGTAIDLSAVAAGTGGFVINGQCASDESGVSVASAGDVNGDGLADLIVGANNSDPAAGSNAGRSYVVFGQSTGTAIDLSAVAAGTGGFVISGQGASDTSGRAVSSAGDVNGDGLADLVVGALASDPAAGTDAGRSYVVFGKSTGTAVDLAAVAAGTGGFVINGQCAGDGSGFGISSAGDFNGDGLADLILGAILSDPAAGLSAGRSYVVFGKSTGDAIDLSAVAAGTGGFVINGQCLGDQSGYSVSAAGDVNGDGLADLIVGAPYSDPVGATSAGRSYVIFGRTNGSTGSTMVDQLGTTGADTLSDSGTSKTLVGNAGNDTLTATAASVLYGGSGNDRIEIGAAMITALQSSFGSGGNTTRLARVDGGSGVDTLELTGSGLTLDLGLISNSAASDPDGGSRLASLEVIDLTGSGNNTLMLNAADVRDLAGSNRINSGNAASLGWANGTYSFAATETRHQLVVDGDAGDTVGLLPGFTLAGTATQGGSSYNVYTATGAMVLVKSDVALLDTTPPGLLSASVNGSALTLTLDEALDAAHLPAASAFAVLVGGAARTVSSVAVSGSTVTLTLASAVNVGELVIVGYTDSTSGNDSNALQDVAGNDAASFNAQAVTNATPVSFVNLSAITAGSGGFAMNGQCANNNSGYSVSSAGDVNGDGLADVIVGAHISNLNGVAAVGRSYVVFGKSTGTAIELSAVDAGTGGFVIKGQCVADYLGISVSGAGDVNGDGLADLIVGTQSGSAGRSLVVFGKSSGTAVDLTAVVAGTGGFVINGQSALDYSGISVSGAGDVNGDGLADLIVGANKSDTAGGTDAGRSYVVFGQSSGTAINLSAVAAGTGGFVINGQGASDQSGYSVSSAGDVNGDGLADLIVGAYSSDPAAGADAGRSYVVFGKSNGLAIDLSAVANGTGGFVINGQGASDQSGISVSSAGDVNGDGLADLIVGANLSNPAAGVLAGRSYVVFGQSTGTAIELSAVAAGTGGFVINGQHVDDQSGISVASAGDFNGDGLADLIVGAFNSNPDSGSDAGRSYVVFGKSSGEAIDVSAVVNGTGGFVINGEYGGDKSGVSVSGAGDVNGDGLADLIVGAYYVNTAVGTDAGRSYVIFGSASGSAGATKVDQLGTTGADTLSDGGSAQTLVGNAGDDTLAATAASVLYGGSGNDRIEIGAAMITALQSSFGSGGNTTRLARVDGGSGVDTLALAGSGLTLDLTQISNSAASDSEGSSRLAGLEVIDLSGSGNNSLLINAADVRELAGSNRINSGNAAALGWADGTYSFAATEARHQLVVEGNAGDSVALQGAFTLAGTATQGGQSYNVYTDSGAEVLVRSDLSLTLLDGAPPAVQSATVNGSTLSLTMNEAMDAANLPAASSFAVLVAGVARSVSSVAVSGSVVTLTLASAVQGGQAVTIGYTDPSSGNDANALQDLAGNDALGFSSQSVTNTTPLPYTNLSAIAAGSGGFVINGQCASDQSGHSVSSAGDVNGDGLADLIVGANLSDPAGGSAAGRSYVVFGKSTGTAINLSAVAAGTGGFVINGQCASDFSGSSVASAGDVNGDGLADLIVGAYESDPAGRSYVVFGQSTGVAIDLSAVAAGTGGFVINGQGASDQSGYSVASAGDVNGDGLADLIVGANLSDPAGVSGAGRSYVVFGQSTGVAIDLSAVANGMGGFVINGQCGNDNSGYSVSSAGDVNGDGLADLIVGAYLSDPAAGLSAGRSYVVFGQSSGTAIDLSAVAAGTGGFVINGQTTNDQSGWSVSSAGDVNGDGLADVIVGAVRSNPGTGAYTGRSYVVFGQSTGTAINLSAVAAGTGGFVIIGQAASEYSGHSVSSAGDMNGDGLADLIVGAYRSDPTTGSDAGRSYVVFGKSTGTAINLSAVAAGTGGFVINGQCANDQSGWSVSSAGDVNGDGLADLIVGARASNPSAGSFAGRSYVIFGNTNGNTGATMVDQLGTTGADTLSDGGSSQTLVGNAGDDTLTASAASVLLGGSGNDRIEIGAATITALQSSLGSGGNLTRLARVDGGSGVDTLALTGSGLTLDLTQISNSAASDPEGGSRLASLEVIDLTGSGNNTLMLNAADVRDLAGSNRINSGNAAALGWANGTYSFAATETRHQLVVEGNAGDAVTLSGAFTLAGTATQGGNTYNVYTDNGSEVLVRSSLATTLLDSVTPAVQSASVTGNTLSLTMSEALDATNLPVASGFTVLVDGVARTVSSVAVSGSTVTLTLASAVLGGQAVTLGYTDPSSGNDSHALQDLAGNDVTTFSAQAVTNATPLHYIDLSAIAAGSGGFVINGQGASDYSGQSVSSAGDVNGDGLADLIVGAPWSDPAAGSSAGRSYVVFGKSTATAIDLSAVATGTGGFVINGQCTNDYSGYSVSSAGDVNGDGLADLIVGANQSDPAAGSEAGRSYVVFGKSTGTAIDLSAVAVGTGGFVINGQGAGDQSGVSVSSAGDVNGDGLADLIVGADYSDPASRNSAGRSYVVFGQSTGTAIDLSAVAAGTGGFVINGQCVSEWSGRSVSSAGDVNGDGLADLIVGAYNSSPASGTNAGRSYVVFGKSTGTVIDLSAVAVGTGGFVINGQCATDYSGISVASAGDVNGDGLADLIVGAQGSAPAAGSLAGRSYVVFGQSTGTAIELSAVAVGTGGFVINGQGANDQSGRSVSSAGDVNGDGLADLIVSANLGDPAAGSAAGRSYVVFGKSTAAAIDLSAVAAGTGGFVINGQCASDQSGRSVSSAGDVNGDGLADLIVGAIDSDPAAGTDAGRSYVIFGSTGPGTGATMVDQLGTTGADTLTDSGTSQTLVGNAGDDTLAATAASVLYGGSGNDRIEIGAATITALQSNLGSGGNITRLARIDGGGGMDTLALSGSNLLLDLTQVSDTSAGDTKAGSRLDSIEKIDLTGSGDNSIRLTARDVFDLGTANLFASTGRTQILINGDAGDTVDLADGAGTAGWTHAAGTETIGGQVYEIWNNDASNATVYVVQGVVVS